MEKKNNGFLIGLIIGLIIGAIVAIVIYKNNKSKVFKKLKASFPVVTKSPSTKKPKMFVKPKK